jgi:hypothetical protein
MTTEDLEGGHVPPDDSPHIIAMLKLFSQSQVRKRNHVQVNLVAGLINIYSNEVMCSQPRRVSTQRVCAHGGVEVFPTPCTEPVRARFIASPPLQYITSNSFGRASFPLKLICSFTLISIYIFI